MKKMGYGGWSLNEMLAGIGILAFALVLATVLFESRFKQVEETLKESSSQSNTIDYTYEDMETELVNAASNFITQQYKKNVPEGAIKITMEELHHNNLYANVKDPKDSTKTCKGYVLFTKTGNSFSYKPYIKCNEHYITEGYR